MTDDRTAALAFIGADSRMEARLDTYVDLLARWRKATNLMSESAFSKSGLDISLTALSCWPLLRSLAAGSTSALAQVFPGWS